MKLTRAIRTDGIVTALWLAWAIITPIDWLIDRLREAADRTKQGRGEVRSVVGRVRIHREAE